MRIQTGKDKVRAEFPDGAWLQAQRSRGRYRVDLIVPGERRRFLQAQAEGVSAALRGMFRGDTEAARTVRAEMEAVQL